MQQGTTSKQRQHVWRERYTDQKFLSLAAVCAMLERDKAARWPCSEEMGAHPRTAW
jgi:hypothetical protein